MDEVERIREKIRKLIRALPHTTLFIPSLTTPGHVHEILTPIFDPEWDYALMDAEAWEEEEEEQEEHIQVLGCYCPKRWTKWTE